MTEDQVEQFLRTERALDAEWRAIRAEDHDHPEAIAYRAEAEVMWSAARAEAP